MLVRNAALVLRRRPLRNFRPARGKACRVANNLRCCLVQTFQMARSFASPSRNLSCSLYSFLVMRFRSTRSFSRIAKPTDSKNSSCMVLTCSCAAPYYLSFWWTLQSAITLLPSSLAELSVHHENQVPALAHSIRMPTYQRV